MFQNYLKKVQLWEQTVKLSLHILNLHLSPRAKIYEVDVLGGGAKRQKIDRVCHFQ